MGSEKNSSVPRGINPELGQFIRQRRNALGLSVRDVASQLGCSPGQLTRIENGTRRMANAKWVHDLADILSVPYDELAKMADEKTIYTEGSILHQALPSLSTPMAEKAISDFATMIKTRHLTDKEIIHIMVTIDALSSFFEQARKAEERKKLINAPASSRQ